MVSMEEVVYLDCPADVVLHRIKADSGRDRASRSDDSLHEIEKKLKIFQERTLPLLEYYRSRNVTVRRIRIEKGTSLQEVLNATV